MKVEFIANASFVLTLSNGSTVLTDPWYGDGAYYGSWYNFPPLSTAQREKYLSSRPDFIYVSHAHPDHLDATSLARFPVKTPVLIGKLPHDHLRRSIAEIGFSNIRELKLGVPEALGGFEVTILPQFAGTGDGLIDDVGYALDSSLAVRDADGTLLLNVVDNPIKIADAAAFVEKFGHPHVAILPYGGASFYPHAGRAFSDAEKAQKRDAVKERRLKHFIDLAREFKARWTVPAAGSYVMGGRISAYSEYLHQATPAEIAAAWPSTGRTADALCQMIPSDVLDTASGSVCRDPQARFRDFTIEERTAYALTLVDRQLAQDAVRIPQDFRVPWQRLLPKARRNLWAVQQKLKLAPPVDVEIHVKAVPGLPGTAPFVFGFALDVESPYASVALEARKRATVAFHIDSSLLLMVLLGAAIWNNVEIGALVEFERTPEVYEPTVHSLMSFFAL